MSAKQPKFGGDDAGWWEVRFASHLRIGPGSAAKLVGSAGAREAAERIRRRRVAFDVIHPDIVPPEPPPPPDVHHVTPPSHAPALLDLRSKRFWTHRAPGTSRLKAVSRSTGPVDDSVDWRNDGATSGAKESQEGRIVEQEDTVVLVKRTGPGKIGILLSSDLTVEGVEEGSMAATAGLERFKNFRLSVANGAGVSTLTDVEWFVDQAPDDIELRFVERGVALTVEGAENDCSGRFEQVLGENVNSATVWKKVGADRYIYSTPAGKWIIADRESMSHGGGWAITSKKHQGKPPQEMEKWKQSWMAAKFDPDIKVSVSADQSTQSGQGGAAAEGQVEASKAAPTYGGFGTILKGESDDAPAAAAATGDAPKGIAAAEKKDGEAAAPAPASSGLGLAAAEGPINDRPPPPAVAEDPTAPLVEETRPDPSQPESLARYTRGEFMNFYGADTGVIMWAKAGEVVEPDDAEEGPDVERRIDVSDPKKGLFTKRQFIGFYGVHYGPLRWEMCDPKRNQGVADEDEEEEEEEDEEEEEGEDGEGGGAPTAGKAKAHYRRRKLPFIIGSDEFFASDMVGLKPPSEDGSESDSTETTESSSESESESESESGSSDGPAAARWLKQPYPLPDASR
eukprot:Hpha_TRINITY_DN16830_c2_g1::TRINITY_DN16830_c2_g1_i2::g.153660::m.153660